MKVKIKRNLKQVAFILILLFCMFGVFKASDAPIILYLKDSFVENLLSKYQYGNDIILSLSTGYIVSALFYLMVVYYPEKKKRDDLAPFVESKINRIIIDFGKIFEYLVTSTSRDEKIANLTEDILKEITSKIDLSRRSPIMISLLEFRQLYPNLDPMNYHPIGCKKGEQDVDISVCSPCGYYLTYMLNQCLSSIEESMKYSHFIDSEVLSQIHAIQKRLNSWGYVSFKEFTKYKEPHQLFNYGSTYLWELFILVRDFRKLSLQIYSHDIPHDPFS